MSYLAVIPSGGWTDEYKTTQLVLRRIPTGTFTMGSPANELGRYSDETQHVVTVEVTQKQWEYAGRAGTTEALNSGKNLTDLSECPNLAEVGRYWSNGGSGYTPNGNTSVGTAKVGSYLSNAWGLYDIHGNVWEWCLDWYGEYPGTVSDPKGGTTGSARLDRGGSWGNSAVDCRIGYHSDYRLPYLAYTIAGFRAVLPMGQ